MKVTSENDNNNDYNMFKLINENMTTSDHYDNNVNRDMPSMNKVSMHKQGFHLRSCSDDHTGLQKWGINYQAALRSQGQYKDEVYIVDDGTLQELTVEHPINLVTPSKTFLHYGGNDDDLSVNDVPVIYCKFVLSSLVWDLFIHVIQLFRLNVSVFNPFVMVGNDKFIKV